MQSEPGQAQDQSRTAEGGAGQGGDVRGVPGETTFGY